MTTARISGASTGWRLALGLPNALAGATTASIQAAAAASDAQGWHDVWVADHVLVDRSLASQYGNVFEAITTLAYVAGAHPELGLGLGVIVAPMRNPVVLGKQLASLDALSGGRLTVGVGVGWSRAEYQNVGRGDRFSRRGRDLDEAIALWRHLWSGSAEPFLGETWSLDDFVFGPLPAQGPDVPILVGGKSDASMRRVIAAGQGHIASQTSPEDLRLRAEALAAMAQADGVPPPPISVRVPFTADELGAGDMVRERLGAYLDAGATRLIVATPTVDPGAIEAWVGLVTSAAAALGQVGRSTETT